MKKVRGRKKYNIFYLVCIILILFSLFFSNSLEILLKLKPDYKFTENTEIHFIDVGQGDAIAIKFASGEVMLIDSGTEEYSKKLLEYIDNILDTDTIDYFVLTHTDFDHSSNVLDIIKRYNIGTFYRPNVYELSEDKTPHIENTHYREILNALTERKIPVEFNKDKTHLNISGILVDWLCPMEEVYNENLSTNEYSPIIIINDNGTKAMFTGDISENIELRAINNYCEEFLDIDILKLAHHGSNYSNSYRFIETTSPKIAVASVGKNTYGHPGIDTIQRILDYDKNNDKDLFSNFYTTKSSGNVVVTLKSSLDVRTIKNIDDYSFVEYYWYVISFITIICYFMALPYINIAMKNAWFIKQNKIHEKNKQKDKEKTLNNKTN